MIRRKCEKTTFFTTIIGIDYSQKASEQTSSFGYDMAVFPY